jgi:hypothetical protein
VNWRALGCGALALAAFLAIGLLGLSMALTAPGCPDRLQWGADAYLPASSPATRPIIDDEEGELIGTTFIGLTTRDVYGPPGTAAAASGGARPEVLALDCADGTFVVYRPGD